jgi:hypothetical protein
MCYNSNQSFLFFIVGIITVFYIYLNDPILRKTNIHLVLLFYCAMELLQTVQYFYVNQCENWINKVLTEFAYVLVIFQPLIWNLFFYTNSDKYEKYIFLTAIYLCLCWMFVNICSRLLYKKVYIPQTPRDSAFADDKICTKKLHSHLYWVWTSANFYEFNANYLMYVLLWFIPALISKSSFYYAIIIIIGAFIGAMYGYTHNADELYLTFTAAWCFISVPIVLAVMFKIIYTKYVK